mmetsp:Transcript_13882/g.28266  ORF Transcript_13882/g.28266 Transcript_13882/m.28266 type:complete len:114 (+) Transcript_13882:1-342(+)
MGRSELIQLFHSFLLSMNTSVLHAEKEKETNTTPNPSTLNNSSSDIATIDRSVTERDATNDDAECKWSTCTDQDIIKAATYAADDVIKYKTKMMVFSERRLTTAPDEKKCHFI